GGGLLRGGTAALGGVSPPAVSKRWVTARTAVSKRRVRRNAGAFPLVEGASSMSLSFQVLGGAGRDNALLVRVDSGQAVSRLLFDCGDGCLWDLPFGEVQTIDHLLFSHLHMDHVGGFDTFFRCTYNRTAKPNPVWGPPCTGAILRHRFQGFLWNLHTGQEVS